MGNLNIPLSILPTEIKTFGGDIATKINEHRFNIQVYTFVDITLGICYLFDIVSVMVAIEFNFFMHIILCLMFWLWNKQTV